MEMNEKTTVEMNGGATVETKGRTTVEASGKAMVEKKAAVETKATKRQDALLALAFDHPCGHRVRILPGEEGGPLFCCKDVCEALGYRSTCEPVRKHVGRAHLAMRSILVAGVAERADGYRTMRPRQMYFMGERGLRQLVDGSGRKEARAFWHWTATVLLPAIRQGGYCEAPSLRMEVEARERRLDSCRSLMEQKDLLIAEQDDRIGQLDRKVDEQVVRIAHAEQAVLDLEGDVDRLLPKALYVDNVLDSLSCYTTTQVAKELGLTAQELNRQLCALRIQYYQSGQYLLYAEYAHRGLAKSRTCCRMDERVHSGTYLVWTERGRKFIHDRMGR